MHFKILTRSFLEPLNIVSRAISPNSPLPSLHGVKIVVNEDKVILTASDMNISIQATINADDDSKLTVYETGSIVLEARYFTDMVRKLDSEYMEIEIIDGYMTKISGDAVNFELNGTGSDNYPLIEFTKPEKSFVLNVNTLKDIVSQTCFATSDKEVKPVLTGLNMKSYGNKLLCVATDRYRLAQKELYIDTDAEFDVTVPAKSLNEIAKIISGDGNVEISLNDRKIMFVYENILLQSKLIEGAYPETSRLIPTNFDYELVIDARDMLNAIDRSSFIKTDGVSIIRMEMKRDEVVISSKSNEIGSVETLTPVSYEGNNLNISFKGQFVYEAVRALNAFNIRLRFSGDMKPFVITSTDNNGVLQLVLPIKTYN